MEVNIDQKPDLFADTAVYYARYRIGYPDSVFDALAERFRLDGSSHVLDLGCGTGQIAIPLAKKGIPVHAVDPDADMLAEGIKAEARAGVLGVSWQRGEDRSLERLHLPILRLCTMGASFHWMDRDNILAKLDRIISADGGVAIVSGESIWSGSRNEWQSVTKDVVTSFLGEQRRAGKGTYSHPIERHGDILARSAFCRVDKLKFEWRRSMTSDDIIGLQLSTSYSSPTQLGAKLQAFKTELRERLRRLNQSERFEEDVTTEVLIGIRDCPSAGKYR